MRESEKITLSLSPPFRQTKVKFCQRPHKNNKYKASGQCTRAHIQTYICKHVCVSIVSKATGAWGVIRSICVGVYSSVRTPTHTCMDSITRTHTRMYVYMYIDNSAAGELSKSDQRLYICACAVHTFTHIYICICTYICVRVRVCDFIYFCALCLLALFFCLLRMYKKLKTYLYEQWKCAKRKHIYLFI